MYGAQHDYILGDRDVNEYNMNRKLEQFAHLRQDIQKLIIYSTEKVPTLILYHVFRSCEHMLYDIEF